jgi:hypothetical protein
MVRIGTRVFFEGRTFIVIPQSEQVLSGPFPGGRYKPLPSQQGKNALRARSAAAGKEFNDGAYSVVAA